MPLPSSGSISLSQVNVELGLSSTAQISLNDNAVRTLFGKASGAIAMSDGYGKANQFAFTISSNQSGANLRTLAINAGWNQSSKLVATIASGVQITSSSTGTPALTVSGSFPGGVELINNGTIVGRGGTGGAGGGSRTPDLAKPGTAGGTGLSVSSAITITNNATIGGGGGGGGGGGAEYDAGYDFTRGGGGGGGGGGFGPGGLGFQGNSGGGGDGATGTLTGGGAGGASTGRSGAGGAGGSAGSAGSAGQNGFTYPGAAGGSGGAAVSGNSNITWAATGTRLGAIT